MTYMDDDPQKSKIGPEFTARLLRLSPRQKVRAILVLDTKDAGPVPWQRHSRAERQAAIDAIRKWAKPALIEIDGILKLYEGKRLATGVDALGSVPVETTAAGIIALAACEHITGILEDQEISLLRERRHE